MVAWSCALTGNSNLVFLLWESGLESHVFLHLFFLLSMYLHIFLEKKIEQLLHQSLEPTLSVLSNTAQHEEEVPWVEFSVMNQSINHSFFLPKVPFRASFHHLSSKHIVAWKICVIKRYTHDILTFVLIQNTSYIFCTCA